MEEIITVTGKGSVHVVPDVTRLSLTLESIHDTYEEAYLQAKENTERLGRVMNQVKLDPKLPKTIRMDIDKKTIKEYDHNNHFTGVKFLGFALDHQVKIDLGMDNVLLNSIVKLIGQELKQAEINIGYTVRDTRPAQLKMLEKAVKDAREKARIMAAACDCRLGAVKDIRYGAHEIHVFSEARMIHSADEAVCCSPESLDITPDDLEFSDSVTVVWRLSNNAEETEER